MTTYKDIPQPQDNRNQSQSDLLANFEYLLDVRVPSALAGIMPVDHFASGNNTLNPTDGFHKQISLQNRTTPANLTNATNSQASSSILYGKNDAQSVNQLHFFTTGNVDYQVTPCLPLRASISFDGTVASGSAVTLYSSFNIDGANTKKTATGLYTITFTNAIPTNNYIVLITGMRSTSGEVFGFIQGDATKTTSQTTALVKIGFQSSGGSARDVIVGNVMVYGG